MAHRILIMEDERPLARAMQLKLTGAGFDVDVASDGVAGLEKLAASTYDLLLIDLIMPRMDGFKVLEELQQKHPETKVIVLSNLGQAEDIERAKKLGALDYFIKADTPLAEIVDLVTKTLE